MERSEQKEEDKVGSTLITSADGRVAINNTEVMD